MRPSHALALALLPLASACALIVGLKDRNLDDGGADQDAAACEGPHMYPREDAGRCYRFASVPETWQSAESDCATSGGHLVSITSPDEQSFVIGIVANEIGDAGPVDGKAPGVWIGLAKDDAGTYAWSNGEPLGFTNWAINSPSGKPCVFEYSATFNNHWDDFMCDVTAPYICER